ncbi:hypothetical protein [Deinococcus sp. 12RED42]|uniref:hypothetical protein n=1 Tax=Deinococcus sp. 12RED42 TaxID=2745872 RepID=UPI001E2833E1|nr:hypothetical protein [Deinococcus sp. 12RED42]MCD0164412.1 hypothetical protein [Deinococcus sp. 12RED42]
MHRQKRFVPTRLTLLIPVMLMALGNAAAQEGPLLGSSRTLAQTSFCRTYVCSKPVSGSTPTEGLKTLTYKVTEKATYSNWNIITTSKGGKVVSVRWSAIFQDNIIYEENLTMALKLSQVATGRTVEKGRLNFMDKMAMALQYVTPARLGNGHVYSMVQPGGIGERLFSLVFTTLNPTTAVWSEPPRNFMNEEEKRRLLTRMSKDINTTDIVRGITATSQVGPCGTQPFAIKVTRMGTGEPFQERDWPMLSNIAAIVGSNNGFSSMGELYEFQSPWRPMHRSFTASYLTGESNKNWGYACLFIESTSLSGSKQQTVPLPATYR